MARHSSAPPPTQVEHPWRATARTLFQLGVGMAAALPMLVGVLHLPASAGVAGVLAVSVVITRLMAMPEVDAALEMWVPWLAAAPRESSRPPDTNRD